MSLCLLLGYLWTEAAKNTSRVLLRTRNSLKVGVSVSMPAPINNLKNKLEEGDLLSEDEVEEMKKHIEGLRATAAYLQQSANELEEKLNEQLV